MTHREWERLGAAAGIAGVVVLFIGMLLPGTLSSDASAEEIRQFMIDKHDRLMGQAALISAGVLLFLLFLATLRNVLRRTEGGTGELSAVMSGSALVFTAMVLVCISGVAGMAWRSADTLDANTVRMVWDIAGVGFVMIGIPTAVFLGTAAVLMRRSDAFPMWMPIIAGVAALVNALAPATLFFDNGAWGPLGVAAFAPPIAFMLVVLAAGGVLVQHPEAGDARMPAGAMPTPA